MREQRSYTDASQKKKKWNTRGFYITLGVCLVAVGMAAWTTYASISNSMKRTDTPINPNPVGQTLSGVLTSTPESKLESETSRAASSTGSSKASESTGHTTQSSSSKHLTVSQEDASKPASSAVTSAVTTVGEPSVFTYPIPKDITRAYSGDKLVYSPTMQDWRVHQGMDLRAKVGDVVKSAAQGTVKDIYKDALLGNVIVISHGSVEIRYCGLGDTALVKKGASVKAGQEIGSIGTVPLELTEEPHLHIEVRRNGKLEDPASVLVESAQMAS